MYHPDLREEIRFLKARLLYKTKKLDEARTTNPDPQKIAELQQQVQAIEEQLHICQTEIDAQQANENDDRQSSPEA